MLMQALIIAAGKGSRLNHNFLPKPLVRLSGSRILEHIILRAKTAGIGRFRIVVGYKGDLIRETMGDGKDYGVEIDYIFNPEWEKGNGLSVLKAKDCFTDPFFLLMADHLFDSAILKTLQGKKRHNDDCVLCVDRNIHNGHINLDDATKIWSEGDRVARIGKNIDPFNGIDSGIFLYSPLIFRALEDSSSRGGDTLSDGNQVLSDWGKLATMDIGSHPWIDIDDPEDLQRAKTLLDAETRPS